MKQSGSWARSARRLFLASILIAWASWCAGDVIHLKNGKKAEGQVVSREDGMIVLKTSAGQLKLPDSLVDRIEKTEPAFPPELAGVQQLLDKSRYEEAYRACEELLKKPDLKTDLKGEAEGCRQAAIDGAMEKVESRYCDCAQAGELDRCLGVIESLRAEKPPTDFDTSIMNHCEAHLRATLAAQCLDRKDYSGVVSQIDRIDGLKVKCPPLFSQLGAILLETPTAGSPQRAVEYLRAALKENPDDDAARVDLICALVGAGKTRESLALWEEASKEFARSSAWTKEDLDIVSRAMRNQAFAAIKTGQRERALTLFAQGLNLALPSAELYGEGVNFYTMAGDPVKADQMSRRERELASRLDNMIDQQRKSSRPDSLSQASGGETKQSRRISVSRRVSRSARTQSASVGTRRSSSQASGRASNSGGGTGGGGGGGG